MFLIIAVAGFGNQTAVDGVLFWKSRADIRQDTVFMPFHFAGEGSANRVTTDATDPVSGMPEFKVSAVAIAREAVAA